MKPMDENVSSLPVAAVKSGGLSLLRALRPRRHKDTMAALKRASEIKQLDRSPANIRKLSPSKAVLLAARARLSAQSLGEKRKRGRPPKQKSPVSFPLSSVKLEPPTVDVGAENGLKPTGPPPAVVLSPGGNGLLTIEENPNSHSITIKIPKKFCLDAISPSQHRSNGHLSSNNDYGKNDYNKSDFSKSGKHAKRRRTGDDESSSPILADDDLKQSDLLPIPNMFLDTNIQSSDDDEKRVDAAMQPPALREDACCQTDGVSSRASLSQTDRIESPPLPPPLFLPPPPPPPPLFSNSETVFFDIPPSSSLDAAVATDSCAVVFMDGAAQIGAEVMDAHTSAGVVVVDASAQSVHMERIDFCMQCLPSTAEAEAQTDEVVEEERAKREKTPEPQPPPPPVEVAKNEPKSEPSTAPCSPPKMDAVAGLLMLASSPSPTPSPSPAFFPSSSSSSASRRGSTVLSQFAQISPAYHQFVNVETHPNGQASLIRCDWLQLRAHLSSAQRFDFARQFIALGLAETDDTPQFVMGVISNAAAYLQDFLEYLATQYPQLPVKVGSLTSKQTVETMPIVNYRKRVLDSYKAGTFRFGPLNSVSLVGAKQEEVGDHFPELLTSLEQCPFLKPLMPWGEWSAVPLGAPTESDDGPILWVRPGEQLIRTDELKDDTAVLSGRGRKKGGAGSSRPAALTI
uniref:Uncharacterized protein n=1 Tax=Plectus sambesii TaxID=2011161 RepID=A0A914WKU1_9BILA